jgi:hypothetical protein
MSSGLEAILQMAVNFFMSPFQHQDLLDGGFTAPDGFAEFLEFSGRGADSQEFLARARSLGLPAGELKQACLFFVRQCLFAEGNNHYQVLGVSREADTDEIKHHYRLLISLFHPDRNPEGHTWNELFAAKINEAYNTLKRQDKRQAYDRTLQCEGERSDASVDAPAGRRPASPNRASHVRPRRRHAEYHATPFEFLYRFSIWQRSPKLMIWAVVISLFLVSFAVLILGSGSPVIHQSGTASGTGDSQGAKSQTGDDPSFRAMLEKEPVDALPVMNRDDLPGYLYARDKGIASGRSVEDNTSGVPDVGDKIQDGKIQDGKEEVAAVELSRSTGNRGVSEISAALEKMPEGSAQDASFKIDEPLEPVEMRAPLVVQQKAVVMSTETVPDAAVTSGRESVVPADSHDDVLEADSRQQALADKSVAAPGEDMPGNLRLHGTEVMPEQDEIPGEYVELEVAVAHGQPASTVDTMAPGSSEAQSPGDLFRGRGEHPDEVLRHSELILASYLSAYETGNLEQLLSLFHPDVVTDDGAGIGIIEKDYDRLFRNSLERRLVVKRSEWSELDPEKVKLVSEVDVQVLVGRFDEWQHFSGVMSFHFQRRDGLTQISELRFELEQR